MSKFKVGDKVAHIDTPTTYFGRIASIRCNNAFVKVPPRYDSGFVVHLDSLAHYQEIPDMNIDEIYDMLEPKMSNILHWNSVESIKTDPFPPQILEWVDNMFNVRYQQYCNECDIKQAIALAYRSGYLRAKKGRPFKIGGEKE